MKAALSIAASIATLIGIPAALGEDVPCILGLGDLPGGGYDSVANGVSDDGTVAVGMGDPSDDVCREAFRWSATDGMVGLGSLPGGRFHSWAMGTSVDGSVVVGASESEGAIPPRMEAFRWTPAEGMVGLGFLTDNPNWRASEAWAVSADGTVIVGEARSDSGRQAFRWTADEGLVGLGDLPGGNFASGARDISADGGVVVGFGYTPESGSRYEGFRWTAATGMERLGDLPGGLYVSSAQAVSADGSTIVGTSSSSAFRTEAFRWTEADGMTGLGALAGGKSEAHGVSADGSIVVGSSDGAAFIWDEVNGMRDLRSVLINEYGLDLSEWSLAKAWDITPDGMTIVGEGGGPDGGHQAWLVRLPEPATALLLLVIAASMARRRTP